MQAYMPGIWASSRPSAPAVTLYFAQTSGATQTNDLVRTWVFNRTTGYGSTVSSPASQNQGQVGVRNMYVHPSNNAIAFGAQPVNSSSLTYIIYGLTSTGYGTKYSPDPSTWNNVPPSFSDGRQFGAYSVNFSPTGNSFYVNNNAGSPETQKVWAWSVTSGAGTKYAAGSGMSRLSNQIWRSISMNASETSIAMVGSVFGSSTPTLIDQRNWSNTSGWGSAYSNPNPTSAIGNSSIQFRPANANGEAVVMPINIAGQGTIHRVFPWSSSTGYGTAQSPSANGQTNIEFHTWSPSGDRFATSAGAGNSDALFIIPYTTSPGTAQRFSNATWVGIGFAPSRLGFAPDASVIATSSNNPPRSFAWRYTGNTIGTAYTAPTSNTWGNISAPTAWNTFWER